MYLENRILKESIREKDKTSEGHVKAWQRRNENSKKNCKKCNAIHRRQKKRLSKKEHREDALALRADERRDKLRKAAGRSKYPEIRRYLNGGTHMRKTHVSIHESIVYGREPGELKHLSSRRKRKKHRFPK